MGKDTNKDREKMTPLQRERIQNRLEKRCADLNKRYPKNSYEVRDNRVILVAGVKRHKVSKKAPKT